MNNIQFVVYKNFRKFYPQKFITVLFFITPIMCHAALFTSFTTLGDLPGGTFASFANAVSPDGTYVVGSSRSSSGRHEAFRWDAQNGMIGLGHLDATYTGRQSFAYGVSNNGIVVGESRGKGTREAFRWNNGTMEGLGILPNMQFSIARAISADGSVIVGDSNYQSSGTSRTEAFRWDATNGIAGLGYLAGGSNFSRASSITSDGNVIVGSSQSSNGTTQVSRWENGVMTTSQTIAETHQRSEGVGVTQDGSTILVNARTTSGQNASYLWTDDSVLNLPLNPPTGITDDGSMILFSQLLYFTELTEYINIFDQLIADGFDLRNEGWINFFPTDISADGSTVVGYGEYQTENGSYVFEAWSAKMSPVPIPPALWLFGSAFLGLLGFKRKKIE